MFLEVIICRLVLGHRISPFPNHIHKSVCANSCTIQVSVPLSVTSVNQQNHHCWLWFLPALFWWHDDVSVCWGCVRLQLQAALKSQGLPATEAALSPITSILAVAEEAVFIQMNVDALEGKKEKADSFCRTTAQVTSALIPLSKQVRAKADVSGMRVCHSRSGRSLSEGQWIF